MTVFALLKKFHKGALSFLLIFSLISSLSACGGGLVNNIQPQEEEEEKPLGFSDYVAEAFSVSENTLTMKRDRKQISYTTERFQTEGLNAFYILPGLENYPDAMAEFQVIDYNSRGEFVYFYVTPCYTDPENIEKYGKDNTGTNPDRYNVVFPENRTNDYNYDAAVLMTYNPDTGEYRVLFAKVYEIDKEGEFDPGKEGRPFYYRMETGDEETDYRAYISERILACKVAGKEEYLLLDQGGLTGYVYDPLGNMVSSMAYKYTLTNEVVNKKKVLMSMEDKKEEELMDSSDMEKLNEWREAKNEGEAKADTGSKDTISVLINGIAMTERYETYLGTTFFLGNNLIESGAARLSTTYMIYRKSLNDEGGVPFISVNSNADKQREQWLSLDGKFFTSREEYEKTTGYSMTDMKQGKNGEEYEDMFTPFIAGSDSGNSSVLVEVPNIMQIPWKWRNVRYAYNLIEKAGLTPKEEEDLKWYVGNFKSGIDVVNSVIDIKKVLNNLSDISRQGKRMMQFIASDSLSTGIGTGDLSALVERLAEIGWVPVPGEFDPDNEKEYNRIPEGFFKESENDGRGVTLVSDHILSVVSVNGIYNTYMSPVDYFPESKDDAMKKASEVDRVKMEPVKIQNTISRNAYIYDIDEADKQKDAIIKDRQLSDETKDAIDEITMLLRTSEETRGQVKLAWFLSQVTGDMDEILDEILEDAEEKYDDDELSEKEYENILDLYDDLEEDREDRNSEDVFEKIREDAEKKHDKGELSDKEYEDILKIIDKAEEDQLGLDDEEFEILERLIAGSKIIDDAKKKIEKGNEKENLEILEMVNTLSLKIPEEIREGMLYLCAGFYIERDETGGYPIAYKARFPENSAVTVKENGQAETVGGYFDSFRNGVLVASECEGEWYDNNTFLVGYNSAENMDLFVPYIYGKPMDVSSMDYADSEGVRTIVTVRTDKGVRFFEKKEDIHQFIAYNTYDLEMMLGRENATKVQTDNVYYPLNLNGRGDEAYERVKKEGGIQTNVEKKDFEGFMDFKMLFTSSGYTRDAENRLDEAISEELEILGASEDKVPGEIKPSSKPDYNERFTGHLTSARNICLISRNKALVCSMYDGTKILDLDQGTVADDLKGSYYRAYQSADTDVFKLLGFEENGYSYMDTDLPLAKVYTVEYGENFVERSVIDAFLKMLEKYASDYLHREYRTEIDENGEIAVKEQTEEEKEESIEAGKIFDPEVTAYDTGLLDLAKKYGINRITKEIKDHTETLRNRIAGVKPAITKLYALAGAKNPAGDGEKKESGYYRNLESRMTMAVEKDAIYDILVEIRMNDDVISTLDSELAEKYRSYKEIFDPASEHGKVSREDLFKEDSLSENSAETERNRLRIRYRDDVLNDIIEEYVERVTAKNTEENEKELTVLKKREIFDDYINTLLDQVNPDNYKAAEDNTLQEFLDVINHGASVQNGVRFEEMSKRMEESVPKADAVWKLEEMIISEKVQNDSAYSGYKDWLKDYNERVSLADYEGASLSLPEEAEAEKNNGKTPLKGTDRIRYLRTSNAYKAVIGDLKSDTFVKEFLSGRKETWDDYCKYVIRKAGAGVVRDENGDVEEINRSRISEEKDSGQ